MRAGEWAVFLFFCSISKLRWPGDFQAAARAATFSKCHSNLLHCFLSMSRSPDHAAPSSKWKKETLTSHNFHWPRHLEQPQQASSSHISWCRVVRSQRRQGRVNQPGGETKKWHSFSSHVKIFAPDSWEIKTWLQTLHWFYWCSTFAEQANKCLFLCQHSCCCIEAFPVLYQPVSEEAVVSLLRLRLQKSLTDWRELETSNPETQPLSTIPKIWTGCRKVAHFLTLHSRRQDRFKKGTAVCCLCLISHSCDSCFHNKAKPIVRLEWEGTRNVTAPSFLLRKAPAKQFYFCSAHFVASH